MLPLLGWRIFLLGASTLDKFVKGHHIFYAPSPLHLIKPMEKEVLSIIDVFEIADEHLGIGLNTDKAELRDKWREMTVDAVKSSFQGKQISIFGDGYRYQTLVLDVDILNSLADFKNVYLKIDGNLKGIQVKDKVEVEL